MEFDVAIIGAGIAGASVAAALGGHRSVALIEAEDTPGYHSTARSAAMWHETLGGPRVRALTMASHPFLRDGGFLSPRPTVNVATADHVHFIDAMEARFAGTGAALKRVDGAGVRALVPKASPDIVAGLIETDCADIDTAALHQHFLKAARQTGTHLLTDARVEGLVREGDVWRIGAGGQTLTAGVVVNAAGAWADAIAAIAGARPLGLQPMRRTIAQVRVDADAPRGMAFVIDAAGEYYFKEEGERRFWVCPHDETACDACDAAPDEYDVALAIDRFERATEWRVQAVERKWAGLRTFAPDRLPIYGFDPVLPGFFWCAGQGGVGIQTSFAAGRLCAHLLGADVPCPEGVDPAWFAPQRFGSA